MFCAVSRKPKKQRSISIGESQSAKYKVGNNTKTFTVFFKPFDVRVLTIKVLLVLFYVLPLVINHNIQSMYEKINR